MIGTNNVAVPSQSATEIVEGVATVVDRLHEKLPDSRIILLSVLPAGMAGDPVGPRIAAVNAGLATLDARPFVHFLDLHPHFQGPDGGAAPEFMQPDRYHLNADGYARWAALMQPLLSELMGSGPRDAPATK